MAVSLGNLAQGNSLIVLTIPTSEEVNAPANAVGKLVSLELYDSNNSEINSGFSIPITFQGIGDASQTQKLYRQQSDGSFAEVSGVTQETNGNDITFTFTSFSVYTVVNETVATTSSGGGGGGGGCLLK